MKSPPFEYARAGSIEEACELLSQHGDDAKVIAGGQSLVPMMAFRLLRPAWLIDINAIDSLKFIAIETDAVRMGACTRQCDIQRDDALAEAVPLLRQALAHVGHVQTRNRGTAGGSLVHADPSAELPLTAQVLEARMVMRSQSGTRTLPAAAFFEGAMTTAVRPDECVAEIQWPVWRETQDRLGLHRDQPPPWRLRDCRRRRAGRGRRRRTLHARRFRRRRRRTDAGRVSRAGETAGRHALGQSGDPRRGA